jgi:glutamate-1-semialdehyde 2,1-aminomutase
MSGTYLAHLTTVMGALAALGEYSRPGFYAEMDAVGEHFFSGFQEIIDRSGLPMRLQYIGPRFGMYFGVTEPVTNYRQAAAKNQQMEHAFIAGCVKRGVFFHASPHHGFSAAHSEADMDLVLDAIDGAMAEVKEIL